MRVTIVIAAILAGAAAPAAAYPQFQLSTGADRCQACHFSPAGGGLLGDYGRGEAADTISRGGDGGFLHGAWSPPDWFQIGGDLRLAGLVKGRESDREVLAFPMQGEVYVHAGGKGITLNLTVGLRGAARGARPLVERLASREHYLMYEREALYVRAGRFFPIFGIRTQDHTAYVRRYLDFGTLEEPYGVAVGTFRGSWEGHASAYVPSPIPFLGAGPRARGAVAYVERRMLGDTAAIGAQARVAVTGDDARYAVGGVGKRWLEGARLLLLAEVDLQRHSFDGAGPTRYQLATYLGATQTIVQGVLLGAVVQRWHPDLTLRSARDAFELNLQVFPRAHFELQLLARAEAAGGDFDHPDLLGLLQLHYYP